jgi:hypothetical protein
MHHSSCLSFCCSPIHSVAWFEVCVDLILVCSFCFFFVVVVVVYYLPPPKVQLELVFLYMLERDSVNTPYTHGGVYSNSHYPRRSKRKARYNYNQRKTEYRNTECHST